MKLSGTSRSRFRGIVIGASAGGVDALATVLPALPAALGAAVFVVLHLPRERPSLLVDIFTPKCALPVREARDKEPVEPGTIYFAPPDYHMLVDEGPVLALSKDELVNHSRPSIDVLFVSAADLYRSDVIGVILTGANADGAVGLQAIERAGGTAIVQCPDTAYAPSMALAALGRVRGAAVLTLKEIAEFFGSLDTNEELQQDDRRPDERAE